MSRLWTLFLLVLLPIFAIADPIAAEPASDPGILVALVALVMDNFESLGRGIQFTILAILALVTLAAHVAPYTATKRDDFLIPHKNAVWEFAKKVLAIVAGNYKNAKNATKAAEEKAEIKDQKAGKS